MEKKEKEFIKRINIDKADNRANGTMLLIIISILTYVPPLITGEFDFGIVFEIASLVFLVIAKKYMSTYDEDNAKRFIVFSMIAIGWILIYDIIFYLASMQDIADLIIFSYDYWISEILSIVYFIGLYDVYWYLSKADNPEKYKESTDWFYETYEGKDEEK